MPTAPIGSANFSVQAMDVPITVHVDGPHQTLVDEFHRKALEAWSDLLVKTPTDSADLADLSVSITENSVLDAELNSLTSRITLHAIAQQAGKYLQLHAAGIANKTGNTIIAVAASGTGKTTLSKKAATDPQLFYVSDETVAIRQDGSIASYPKPLCLVQPNKTFKASVSASSVGLNVADGPLRVSGILLLDRHPESEADQFGVPEVDILPLFDAIVHLLPQTSYFYTTDRPLQFLANIIGSFGAVLKVSYIEAETLVPLIAQLVQQPPLPLPAIDKESKVFYDQVRIDTDRRLEPIPDTATNLEVSQISEDAMFTAQPIVDILIRDNEALVLRKNQAFRLSELGLAILLQTQNIASYHEVRSLLEQRFGPPEEGISLDDALKDTLQALVNSGLLAISSWS